MRFPSAKAAFALAAATALSGCSEIKETLDGPQLSPMVYPAPLIPGNQVVLQEQQQQTHPASANSLWRAGSRAFFNDQRAKAVGDILTVSITINDSAAIANETKRSRTSSQTAGLTNFFGLENSLGKIMTPSSMINGANTTSSDGNGTINRSEVITLTIAAVVTQVLPNGNLVIQGRQEVKTDRDLRELTVGGIVRPEDISSTNTIKHTQIAEARISYGGRGDIARIQGPPALQALSERFSPF